MLIFTGDINLTDWYFNAGFGIGSRVAEGYNPFVNLERRKEDFWIGNFEGVASEVSCNKGFAGEVFRVSPKALHQLPHFNAYGLANNHAMQHGAEAYNQTVDAIESFGAKCFGSERQKSIIIEHQGKTVSITGMSLRIDDFSQKPLYWHNPEYAEIKKEIGHLPKDAFKVLYVHWGNEYINRPSAQQKRLAHWLIDAGFDLIIGMHPHVLQGYEEYKGKYIFYSLGNFVFEMAWMPTTIGAIVKYDLERNKLIVEYVKIGYDCSPAVVEESSVPAEWRFSYLNEALTKDDNSEQYHIEISRNYATYRKHNHKYILRNMISHPKMGLYLIKDFIKRRL